MTKKINLFLVGTSYQLLSAINMCFEIFQKPDYENHIYYWKSEKLNIPGPIEITKLNGFIKPILLTEKIAYSKYFANYKCDRFFFYQENSILNKYIAYWLRKKGTIICLGPDGTKPYGLFKKQHEFLSMVKDTVLDYRFLLKNKLLLPYINLSRYYRYGASRIIQEVYIQYISLFDYSTNKVRGNVTEMPDLKSQNVIEISKLFNFDISIIKNISGNILYFNQPLWSEKLIQKEIEIIKIIIRENATKKIYIKLHPSTPVNTVKLYSKLRNIVILEDNMPAEFYTALCSNTMCFTGWSAAIMHNLGEENHYFYLYPIFKEGKDKILSQIKIIAFAHIQVVESITKLKELN